MTHSGPAVSTVEEFCRLVEEFLLNSEDRARGREAWEGDSSKVQVSDSSGWAEQ